MFARTLLAISLSCVITSIANAENIVNSKTTSNPSNTPVESYSLTRQAAVNSASAESVPSSTMQDSSPIPSSNTAPLDQNSAAQSTTVPAQAQSDNSMSNSTPATQPIPLPNTPPVQSNTSAQQNSSANSVGAVQWTLDALNQAEWTEGQSRGQLPVYAKAQVLLNRKHASPGAIDGTTGKNTLKAISAYQTMNSLNTDGTLNLETWQSLSAGQTEAAFIEYQLSADDLKGPYAKTIPANYAEQAKMKGLYYTRVTEMLAEKFHMDEAFLKKLNPKASFNRVGERIIVANTRNTLPEDIHLIIAHKGAKQLYLFNSKNKMIASFPATIGSTDTPSPTGTYTIKGIAANPWYSYNPKNFVQAGNTKPLSLPPGPNNPVGNMWIGLSKPSFGIHGTPNPSLISKTASHGCIRLTNWDANDLAKRVKPGITVKFLE